MSLSDAQIERYSRHIILPEVGGRGQERLLNARIAVAGTGHAAAAAAIYLGAAGVGTLRLALLPTEGESHAAATVAALNPDCKVEADVGTLQGDTAADGIAGCDVVVAAADRSALLSLHDACLEARLPLVAVWAEGESAAIGVFVVATSPCLRCCEPEYSTPSGLLAAAAESFAGTIAAIEALKLVLGIGRPLSGRVLLYDSLRGDVRERTILRRGDCTACGARDDAGVVGGR